MKSQLRIFVCSTFSDLTEERKSVLDAIRRLQLEHDSMEFFGARSNEPIETCLAEVRKSNILVVIVGHRYGTLVPDRDLSFCEAEYEEGHKLKKPCLVYMRDENVPVLPKHVERDPDKLRLLENWKNILNARHTVASFHQSADLAVQVAADLGRTIREHEEAARSREAAHAESPPRLTDELGQLIGDALNQGASENALLSAIRRAVSGVLSEAQHLGATVFLSYANSDRDIVREVAKALSGRGIQVWFAESSIRVGRNWVTEIERGLDLADFVLFFISPRSLNREWPQRELQIALHRQVSGEKGAMILPILLEAAEVPPLLRNIQWLDMTDGDVDKAAEIIIKTIEHYTQGVTEANERISVLGKRLSEPKIRAVLEEERGTVGLAAKRLGVSPKRLYQLLKYYNIQAREFR